MSDEFERGYNEGRRAFRKSAGWIVGAGSEIIRPIAEKAGRAAEAAQERAIVRAASEARRRLEFEGRAQYLRGELCRERSRRRPLGRHIVFVTLLSLAGGWLGHVIGSDSSKPVYVILFFASIAAILGIIISAAIRGYAVRRAETALREHAVSDSKSSGGGFIGIVVVVAFVLWIIAKK